MDCNELGLKHQQATDAANQRAAEMSEALHEMGNAISPAEREKKKKIWEAAGVRWKAAEAAEVRARNAYMRCLKG